MIHTLSPGLSHGKHETTAGRDRESGRAVASRAPPSWFPPFRAWRYFPLCTTPLPVAFPDLIKGIIRTQETDKFPATGFLGRRKRRRKDSYRIGVEVIPDQHTDHTPHYARDEPSTPSTFPEHPYPVTIEYRGTSLTDHIGTAHKQITPDVCVVGISMVDQSRK